MILQFLSAIGKLRATASENAAFNLWADKFAEQRNAEYRSTRLQNVSLILNLVVPTIASMVFYWGINDMAKAGEAVNIGDLLSFTTAFTLFWASMQAFVTAFETLLMCIPLYTNAKPILDMYPEIDEGKPDPGMITGRIDFNGVTFRYDADGPTILDNVSFSIQPGEFVALVGPSGSGKSTTLRLLLGFEQPEAGSIYVDGMDVRDVNIRSIRRQMGVVIQNGKVLSGDIGKNIIGASTTLTYEDAWEAAKAAGFDQDIRDLPMGMHTVISEGGGALSGGQRQRLLIARALAGKPRVVLMDEATSALDNRTQQIVTDSLGRMNVTRMVIAHRLSTVAQADRIIVLQSGRIVEQGSYAELMALDGVFAAMARRQIA
jgi:ATP-binding cassette subfamily C protein